MEKINYQLKMIEQIKKIPKEVKPKLLLHCCCAPCSSAVLEKLVDTFDITLYFANSNITNSEEYQKRAKELTHLLNENHLVNQVKIVIAPFNSEAFFKISKGLENEKEKGKRCYLCYQLRLKETKEYAKIHHFDYFTTTLSISPYKNATWINEIGEQLSSDLLIYLYADFKKQNGYKRSIELSKEYGLYRQDYCGCIYSLEEHNKKIEQK